MQFLQTQYIEEYKRKQRYTLQKHFKKLSETKKNQGLPFSFYITTSSIYSSLIEGSTIDEATYMQYKEAGITGNKDFNQVNDLIDAYNYAQTHKLTFNNFLKTHELLSKNLLEEKYGGKFRDKEAGVYKSFIKIYQACAAKEVSNEMKKLFTDIDILVEKKLSYNEVFYFASMLHLSIAQIHPFADGNGRAARLLEKWFLTSMLGKDAWLLQSEKMYWKRRPEYYKSINLGSSYSSLDFTDCVDFLIMLPQAFRIK